MVFVTGVDVLGLKKTKHKAWFDDNSVVSEVT